MGGLEGLTEKYFLAVAANRSANSSCGLPRPDAFHIIRDPLTSDLPWPGILFGMSLPSLWYWCTDQVLAAAGSALGGCLGPGAQLPLLPLGPWGTPEACGGRVLKCRLTLTLVSSAQRHVLGSRA